MPRGHGFKPRWSRTFLRWDRWKSEWRDMPSVRNRIFTVQIGMILLIPSETCPRVVIDSLSNKLLKISKKSLQNSLKVARSCPKFLKSCSLIQPFFPFLLHRCRWWSTIIYFQTTAFCPFLLNAFTAGDVQICNKSKYNIIPFTHTNIDRGKLKKICLPYNYVFLWSFSDLLLPINCFD